MGLFFHVRANIEGNSETIKKFIDDYIFEMPSIGKIYLMSRNPESLLNLPISSMCTKKLTNGKVEEILILDWEYNYRPLGDVIDILWEIGADTEQKIVYWYESDSIDDLGPYEIGCIRDKKIARISYIYTDLDPSDPHPLNPIKEIWLDTYKIEADYTFDYISSEKILMQDVREILNS
jgi:hypothetical protein